MILFSLKFVLGMMFARAVMYRLQEKSRESQTSILKYIFGFTMEPQFTSVTWEWTDPYVVGESMVFFIKVI